MSRDEWASFLFVVGVIVAGVMLMLAYLTRGG